MNKWINVKKNLPRNEGHYLVTSELNYYNGGCWDKNKDGTSRSMQVAYFDITKNWNITHVIAWMDLPKPYEGDRYAKEICKETF